MKKLVSVDIEADGPCPGEYSMVSFGAVVVEPELDRRFYIELAPISGKWIPRALAVSGFSREDCIRNGVEASKAMKEFAVWLDSLKVQPIFIADNPGFDFSFVNYYFHKFTGSNPFGYSSRRIGDLFCGAERNMWTRWKHHRSTKHTHKAIDDAVGNAEALLYLSERYKMKLT